ncbi:hypothetical protein BFJ63_vAg16596 [Fusarium oxysporum f. sp. narcissi]|uniref:Uncharacterized protein n=1 Tax=Fusarium oxysporum f. sp. narcissi TaxID=451672 RepID=A0A4Q2V0W1_FUSOX|nr:hypothetical protein BFJ67_g16397 [Fusarium oxysporum f. sp. cepae]RKK30361.1 hypothetical protein BFJ66_g16352 [Fusarium oxysporum f. sp. cepae]RYC80515.1 hypothetical protein BFJ63_vAg16596 [Fusarium oxysporum f. sp. narcissi]
MAKGDDALAGRQERDIPSHRFEPQTTDKHIYFQGEYISIYNETTKHQFLLETEIRECKRFEVPKGYSVYIRAATLVYWDV